MMLMTDLILKKREGGELSRGEIDFFLGGYLSGAIPDYQVSALLMAIYFRGMTHSETVELTMAMAESGDMLDLSSIPGPKADKHSTGGVGDKTSLVLCPVCAACGVRMPKMSGRGLGHTGGTIDKLESFPGFSAAMSEERFRALAGDIGFVIAGQTADLCPADKKLYALRDVTGTVPSRPLIVSSVMCKKLAAGADVIVLDVKCGSGAFMKTRGDAALLASEMVDVGRSAGRTVRALVTDMDEPLGWAVGNALEVKEALAVLKGREKGRFYELCLALGAQILTASGAAADEHDARESMERSIASGAALRRLAALVEACGGDKNAVYDESLLPLAPVTLDVRAERSGFVSAIEAESVGLVSLALGGGRAEKDGDIDLSVGVALHKKRGDGVARGEPIATIHAKTAPAARAAAERLLRAYTISAQAPVERPIVLESF